jgi:hypothetical protein
VRKHNGKTKVAPHLCSITYPSRPGGGNKSAAEKGVLMTNNFNNDKFSKEQITEMFAHLHEEESAADASLGKDEVEVGAPAPGVPTDTTRPVPGVPTWNGPVLYVVYKGKETPHLDDTVNDVVKELRLTDRVAILTRDVSSIFGRIVLKSDGMDLKKIKTLPSMAINTPNAVPLRGVSDKEAIKKWLVEQLSKTSSGQ